jgi:hypothetical protein
MWMIHLARSAQPCQAGVMSESEFLPLHRLGSTRDLPLNQQAECLLSIVATMFRAMQDVHLDSVNHAVQLYAAKQSFRECVESLCRPLSADDVQALFTLTVISLCERVVECNSSQRD